MDDFNCKLDLFGHRWALVVNNIGRFDVPIIEAQKKVENKDPFEEKLAYGIVLDDSITLNGDSNTKVPKYAFLTITGENSKNTVLISIIKIML